MSDVFSEIFSALFWSATLSFVAWMTLQFGTCVAVSVRRGGRMPVAAACGLIPIPFLGVGIVLAITSERFGHHVREFEERTWDDPASPIELDSDDWSDL